MAQENQQYWEPRPPQTPNTSARNKRNSIVSVSSSSTASKSTTATTSGTYSTTLVKESPLVRRGRLPGVEAKNHEGSYSAGWTILLPRPPSQDVPRRKSPERRVLRLPGVRVAELISHWECQGSTRTGEEDSRRISAESETERDLIAAAVQSVPSLRGSISTVGEDSLSDVAVARECFPETTLVFADEDAQSCISGVLDKFPPRDAVSMDVIPAPYREVLKQVHQQTVSSRRANDNLCQDLVFKDVSEPQSVLKHLNYAHVDTLPSEAALYKVTDRTRITSIFRPFGHTSDFEYEDDE